MASPVTASWPGFVPTLAAAETSPVMGQLVIILITAGLVSLVFQRLRLASIPAYLVAGAIIGPGLLGLIRDDEHVASISQLAIVLLMFGIGLHMDAGVLRRGFASMVGVGALSCALLTGLLALGAIAMGQSPPAALMIGAGLSMSSTAAVMRILQQRRQVRDLHGRLAFGTLIVQDLYAVVVLASVPLLAAWAAQSGWLAEGDSADGGHPGVLRLLPRIGLAVVGIGLIVVLGRKLLPRLLHSAARGSFSELVLIIGAAAGLGSAALTAHLGLSPELGAFLAGFLLASTPARHQLTGQLAPVRDLFIPVFFVSVGLGLDVGSVASMWWVVLAVLVSVVLIKALVIGFSAWAMGFNGPISALAGLILAQAGEFTLLVVSVGAGAGIVHDQAYGVVTSVVALSLIVTPSIIQISPRVAALLVRVGPAPWRRGLIREGTGEAGEPPPEDRRRHAVIAGFGPVGRELYNRLEAEGFECTIVELNPDTVRRQRSLGKRIVYGDASNPEVLHEAGVEHADAVVLTMPDHNAMLAACRVVREAAPEAFIAVRSGFLSRGMQASASGADYVSVDEIAAANVMADEICRRLGGAEPDDGAAGVSRAAS